MHCKIHTVRNIMLLLLIISACSCQSQLEDNYRWEKLHIRMSAYNSVSSQTTDKNPSVAAWGDTLKPGMKALAISRDLMAKGIGHNTPVKIEGFEGIWYVKDKMHSRYRNRMDLYMGTDIQKALRFGHKKMTIWYGIPKDSIKKSGVN